MASRILSDICYETTVEYMLRVSEAKVIKVYDGDTITIGFYMEGYEAPLRSSVRLNGIDTPEMRGKTPEEKQSAKLAQQFLSSQVLGKIISLSNIAKEKYGRILADVTCDGVHINQLMIDTNHAVAYSGGTKQEFKVKK
jgi:endonuclease YncB( thermonuclease family)